MLRIARVDEHGMQQLAARRAESGRPLRAHRVIVEACHRLPRISAILRAEQTRGRAACIPGRPLRMRDRRQPENRIDRALRLALACLAERRRLSPRSSATAIGRAENRRAEMPGLGAHHQHSWCARVLHDVMDDMPEVLRAREFPAAPPRVTAQREHTFPCSDPERHGAPRIPYCRHYFMVGMTNWAPSRAAVGQREVTVLSRV